MADSITRSSAGVLKTSNWQDKTVLMTDTCSEEGCNTKALFWFVWFVSNTTFIRAPPSEFVSSSIPSWQTLTAHAQPFRGARDLAFCLKVPLDSLLVWASSGGSGETARMRRLAWTFAARIGDKYQIRLARPILYRFEGPLLFCLAPFSYVLSSV